MPVLYVTSTTENAGKTLFCAGLGKIWADQGKKPGYLKPHVTDGLNQTPEVDKDVLFMQKLLDLKESLEMIGLSIVNPGEAGDVMRQNCTAAVQGKDILIVEGLPLSKSSSIIEALDAKVLVIHDYANPLAASIAEYKKIGSRLLGVALNKVPKTRLSRIQKQSLNELADAGISLLGVIPEDRILMSMSVMDLAEAIQGKILNNADKAGEIIENFMMGSSTFDRGPVYYGRKNNKAVILWGERPGFRKAALSNLQLAAIQTSSRCIVISGNAVPIPAVVQKAEERQVPLISAGGDLTTLISTVEKAMGNLKFNQEKKMYRLLEILGQNLNSQLLMGV